MSPCWHLVLHDIFSPKHPSESCLLLPSFLWCALFLLSIYPSFLVFLFSLFSIQLYLRIVLPPLSLIPTYSTTHTFLVLLLHSSFFSYAFQICSNSQFPSTPHLLYALIILQTFCDPDCLLLSPLAAPPLLLINHLIAAFFPVLADCYQAMSGITGTPPRMLPWLISHLLKHNDTFISHGTQPAF